LTFDYRGFGKSTGTPTEEGILNDAKSVVEWALHVAGIAPDRILLLGHSLGTAIAAGVAHHYITSDTETEFAGLILCAAFTNCGRAFSSYSIAGIFPLLAPIRLVPTLQDWFSRRMRDTWLTDERLMSLVRESSKFRLVLVHAIDDTTMPWDQTEELFKAALRAVDEGSYVEQSGEEGTPTRHRALKKSSKIIDLGEAGRQEIWQSDNLSISKLIAKHGGEWFHFADILLIALTGHTRSQ
jgi:pimeloyl-ACP methyl ester carboxylesterase